MSLSEVEIDKLLHDLQSEETFRRKIAAEKLGELNTSNEQIVSALIAVWESDNNRYVRYAAKKALLTPVHLITLQQQPDRAEKVNKLLSNEAITTPGLKAEGLSPEIDKPLGYAILGGFFGAAIAVGGEVRSLIGFGVGEALVLGVVMGAGIGMAGGLIAIGRYLWSSFLLAVVGLIFIFVFTGTTILTCKQVEPSLSVTCELVQSHFWGESGREFELQGARMGEWKTDEGRIPYVELQTSNDNVILPNLATSPEGLVSYINEFIKNPRKVPLVYQYGSSEVGYIGGGILILISLFLAIWAIDAKRIASLKVG